MQDMSLKKGGNVFLKSGLLVIALILLGLAVACANSPATLEPNRGAIDDTASLQKVALVVPTIF